MTIMRTANLSRSFVATLLVATCLSLMARTPGANAQSPIADVIQIPIKWCAVEGTTAAMNPSSLGETTTEAVLMRRLQRASDLIWLPGAEIVFRSALPSGVATPAGFWTIMDPKLPPAGSSTEAKGDLIGIEGSDQSEYDSAI